MNAKKQVLSLFPLNKEKGYKCECCDQWVQVYRRTFNANMGIALLALYNHEDKGFVHVEKLLQSKGYGRCGDFSYLRHYGLIEAYVGERKDGSKRNGHYRITGRGIMFAENKLEVNKNFLIFNNKLKGFEGELININQALGNKFNYAELMGKNIPEPVLNENIYAVSPVTASWDSPIN